MELPFAPLARPLRSCCCTSTSVVVVSVATSVVRFSVAEQFQLVALRAFQRASHVVIYANDASLEARLHPRHCSQWLFNTPTENRNGKDVHHIRHICEYDQRCRPFFSGVLKVLHSVYWQSVISTASADSDPWWMRDVIQSVPDDHLV